MIRPHLTFRQVEDYAAKRLAAEEIPALHEHTEICSSCRELLVATVTGAAADHLAEQEAVNYVAGLLPDDQRSRVAKHLGGCPSCAAMVADLEDFRQDLRTPRHSMAWLLPIAATLIAMVGLSVWFAPRPMHTEPAVTAQLRDAGLAAAGKLSAGSADLIATALRTGRLPEGPAALLTQAPDTLRSSAVSEVRPALKVVAPVGVRVVSDRPEFRWVPLSDGASSHTVWQVKVFDEDFNEIAQSGLLHEPVWVPETPLPRLRPMLWQVTATRNGSRTTAPSPPEPSPRFEIVSAEDARQITDAQAVQPPSHLLLAVLYARAGLRKEAASEVDAIAALNPGSPLAASLKQSVSAVR